MTSELPENYATDKPDPSPESQKLAEEFVLYLGTFHWRTDYINFCELMGWGTGNYCEQKYQQFQELVSALNNFDPDAIAKMIEAGFS
ncbi:hypothetical protein IQ276_009540 [Desmonostoc muscorum LEGE 12446]|uniref:Uncharacterized protein n=1 Tax=Desmonostoc muscorum LEGE 12446 TaxID=1828758 RepID=A0A8J6ZT62_DESMC|nr:hypothetical protein [Desmonostoc muscorum]MCF2146689.1 hypothetical protein [Desmonostoc muscorum LEGE 12446]